jgi:hypothetical protein
MKAIVCVDVTPYNLVGRYHCFGETRCLCLQSYPGGSDRRGHYRESFRSGSVDIFVV